MTTGVIDKVYLPFSAQQLLDHLLRPGGEPGDPSAVRQLQYYLDSAERYHTFVKGHLNRRGLTLGHMREPCQLEKDERFWTAACLMGYFYSENRKQHLGDLLCRCFGDMPPVGNAASWDKCLEGDLRLYFETTLPSPMSYKEWLTENLRERQFIPYVLNAACRRGTVSIKKALEGPTRIDAMLLNESNGFSVLFEAKVLSDISVHVTYDSRRNQLARLVDVMLEENKGLPEPLSLRRPEDSLLILITPEVFRTNPSSRLYGWLLNEYRTNPEALARDLSHRDFVDWPALARRIGWLTWEDCARILPESCPWLGKPVDSIES